MRPTDVMTFQEVVLEVEKFSNHVVLTREALLSNVEVRGRVEHMLNQALFEIRALVAKEDFPRREHVWVDYRVDTWWDHWKIAHPKATRRLRLSPAKFRRVEKRTVVDWVRYYPSMQVPPIGQPTFLQMTSEPYSTTRFEPSDERVLAA